MKEREIKIIRLPSFFRKRQFSAKANCCLIPPLGIGLISAYLRSRGIPLKQDDLNIKIHHDNNYSGCPQNKVDTDVFFDTPRMIKYALGEKDGYVDTVIEKAAAKIEVPQNQITLLSLPDNIENDTNLMFALAYARFIKERSNSLNILGGDNVWLDLLRAKYDSKYIDHVIYGEGELASYHFLNHLYSGHIPDSNNGLSFSDNGRVISSNMVLRPIKPDFSGLPMEEYRSREEVLNYPPELKQIMDRFQSSKTLIIPYRFTRGCPFECAFCVSSARPLTHALSPAEVAAHLDSLQRELNPTGFFFLNDTINISKGYINGLCDELIKRKLRILWSDCARVDNLDQDTLFKMRQAGCVRLIFGMETASPRMLEYVNKRIDLRQLEDALRWSDQAGIWAGIEVICGLPHETQDDIDSTIFFIRKNQPYINRIYLNHFDLRENTPFYNSPREYGIKRIFEVNQYAEKDFISYVRFGFDEAGGLCWEDKQKQIEYSLKTVQDNCARGFRYFTDEHLLFFLYAHFADKKEISSIYQKIIKD